MRTQCFHIIFLLISHFSLWAESYIHIKGKVIDQSTQLPIPDIFVTTSKGTCLTNIDGFFELSTTINDSLIIDDFNYDYFKFNLNDSTSKYYIFELSKVPKQRFHYKDQKKIKETLDLVFNHNKNNSIYKRTPFKYKTYNKLIVSTDNEEQNYNLIEYLKKIIPKRYFNFEYNPRHHLFFMETFTEKKYLGKVHQKETILNSKVSGFTQAALLAFNSDFQSTSVYKKYIYFNFTYYPNPLYIKAYKWYNYDISDTVSVEGKRKINIKFFPKNKNLFDAVQGTFIWDVDGNYVQSLHLSPTREKSLYSYLSQEYSMDSTGKVYYPSITYTRLRSLALNYKNINFNITAKTYIYNFKLDPELLKKEFNENAYEYHDEIDTSSSMSAWEQLRKEAFTQYDSTTFTFYDHFGKIKNLGKFINIGRSLYEGKIPINKFNILLGRVINYNQVEHLRIGLGIETNQKFSQRFIISGFGGYGILDEKFKYGLSINSKITDKYKAWLKFSYLNDLYEPGRVEHQFEKQQYSSESFRKYQLQLLDKIDKWQLLGYFNPYKYLQSGMGLNFESDSPYYAYKFENQTAPFNYKELFICNSFTYGRQYIKYDDKQIYFRDRYPLLSLLITRSLNPKDNQIDYTKIDLKLSYNFWYLGKGNHNIQLTTGKIFGNAPYYKLYNSKGSFSNLYTTIYNSFETMGYNEFCSDEYIAVFYNVNFGRLNRTGRFKPSFLISHNMGWGNISNASKHEGLFIKNMNKGYFETGFTLGDILRYNLYGLKIGLGFSTYYRYGSYRFDKMSNNFVFKLATSFRL